MIKKLFDALNVAEKAKNPFDTKEENDAFDKLWAKCVSLTDKADNKTKAENDVFDSLSDFVYLERYTSFAVGFKTAMKLIFDERAKSIERSGT